MNKLIILFMSVFVFTTLNAKVLTVEKRTPVSNIYTKVIDETQVTNSQSLPTILRNNGPFREALHPNVTAVLVDSSVHGYGLVVAHTNPVTYNESQGILIGYRGWVLPPFEDDQGNTTTENNSGFIKAAFSQDGLTFTNYSGLNDEIIGPNGQVIAGPLKGRYPSSVGDADYPYVVWTEATLYAGGGATNNGGRPMYTYDQFGWYVGSFFSPAIDINFGWASGAEPVDAPGDLWVNCPVLVNDGGDKAMVVSSTQWSSTPNGTFSEKSAYVMRSTFELGGSFQFYSLPEVLFDQGDLGDVAATGTTSQTSIDINSSGVGYAMCTAYLTDSTLSERHNFIIRKTTDYGISWSTDGLDGSDYYFMPDTTMERVFVESGFLPDSVTFFEVDSTGDTTFLPPVDLPGVFPLYDHEVRVDESGTLHIITKMVVESEQDGNIYVGLEGSGLYHVWTDNPANPGSWRAAPIAELSTTFALDGMPGGSDQGNYFTVFGTSAISNENDDVMWVAYHALGDTSAIGFNWDIFLSQSMDGGMTWSEPENITNTGGLQEDELYVHMAPTATDSNCYFIYSQPDYSQNHLSVPTDMAAYQQNIWFVIYGGPLVLNQPPGDFTLQSPANGDTVIITQANLNTNQRFEWSESTDPDGTPVEYEICVTWDSEVLFCEGTGADTFYDQPLAEVVAFIDSLNALGLGVVHTFGWQVTASDGINETFATGGPYMITFDAGYVLGVEDELGVPDEFALHQNYPNPFNPVTTIRFDVPEESHIRLMIYNVLGQRIATPVNGTMKPGYKSIRWNGTDQFGNPLPSGMYIYQIQSASFNEVKKLVLMK